MNPLQQPDKQVTFVDTGLPDYQTLIDGLPEGMAVVLVAPDQDGIQVMADWVANHSGYDGIHILGHGSEGAQHLGSATLSSHTLSQYQAQLNQIGSALNEDGDILLYGCNVAANKTGIDFISKLAQATQADVAASDDLTGFSELDGDWELEKTSGTIEAALALTEEVQSSYHYTFANETFGFESGVTGLNTQTVTAIGMNATFTIVGERDTIIDDNAAILTPINGITSLVTGGPNNEETKYTFSIDSGKIFDLSSISIHNWDEAETFIFESSKGTASFIVASNNTNKVIDLASHANAANFQGISSFTITDVENGYRMYFVFDDLVVTNITAVAANTAPALGGTPADTATIEDVATAIDLSAYNVSDADGDTITLTLAVDRGTVATTDDNGVKNGVTIANSGTASMTLEGAVADLNNYLNDTSKITYTPAANDTTAATLTVTPNDGTVDGTADTVTISITPVNDAPVLDNSGSPTLTAIDEDPATNEGTLVSALLGTTLTDVDTGDAEGIAVTAVDNTNGTWQYSTDGTNWSDVGTVSDNSALLLAADDKLRFAPNADYNGSSTVTYRGWDQTSGTAGNKVDTSTNGGTSAFSTVTENASITVNAVNDAPTLSGGPYAFTATDEDTASTGILISTLLAGVTAADVDGDTLGAAISAQAGNGTWQYSTDNSSWTDFGTVGSANSLLLSSSTYVRYNPDGENGETASLTLHAWDGSSGSASTNGSASTVSTLTNGDATAFSTGTINANLTVNPVNDAPTGTDKTLIAQKNSPLTIQIADAGFNDVDTGDALEQIIISTAPALGTLWVDTDNDGTVNGAESALSTNDIVTAADISAGLLKYRPATDGIGSGYTTIGFTVHDGDTSAGSANTWTLNVVSAPEIDLNGAAAGNNATATYTENDSDTPVTLVDAAATITDDDANLKGMSIQISDGAQTGDVIKLDSRNSADVVNGITITYTSDSAISLSGSATKDNYLALLKELTFAQTGDNVGGADRTISVTATDANDQTGVASTITVTATGVNDAPTVATNTGLTLNEAATITIANTQLNATDPDDTASGLTYTVTTATTNGTVWLDANNNSTQDDGEALALNGTFTQDDIDNNRLKYTHDGGETTSDSLGFSLADGGEDGAAAVTGQSFAITVTPQNDDPTISELSGDSLAYVMGSDALVIDQGTAVSVTDPDSADFNTGALTVSITNNGVNTEDKLSIRNQGTEAGQIGLNGFDVTYGGTLIGTLGGGINGNALTVNFDHNATAAALSALLSNITYENLDSTTATENTRTVRFVLTDGDGGTSANIDTSVVVSRNAAPVITSNSGGDTAAINVAENSTSVTTVTATDADSDTVTFSISGGADSTLFAIDANSGALTFKSAPNFENPLDTGDTAGNNTYVVEVTAEDARGGIDTQMLTVTVTDVNEAAPAPQPTTDLVDGTPVTTQTQLENGKPVSQITIEPVISEREDTDTSSELADIPLHFTSDNTPVTILRVPEGVGVTARANETASSQNGLADALFLLQQQSTPESDEEALVNSLERWVSEHQSAVGWVNKITLTGTGSTPPTQPIKLSGSEGDNTEVIIVDAGQLPAGSQLELDNIEFAIITGEVTIRGGAGSNVVFAGSGSQNIVLGADDDELHGGSGDDTLGSEGGDDRLFGEAGNDTLFGGAGADLLHGGIHSDVVTYTDDRAAYMVEQRNGMVTVTRIDDATDRDTLVNVERITFADDVFIPEYEAGHQAIATLYQQVLGRQADLGGFQWWSQDIDRGLPLGDISAHFLRSAEYEAQQGVSFDTLSIDAQIEQLYEAVLGRASDAAGKAFWLNEAAQGSSIEQIAGAFVTSVELQGQYLQAEEWSFLV